MKKYAVDIWDEWGNVCLTKDFGSITDAFISARRVMREDETEQFLGYFISEIYSGKVIVMKWGDQPLKFFRHEEISRFELMEIE